MAHHDTLFFYTGGKPWTWNPQFTPLSDGTIRKNDHYKEHDGRLFRVSDLTANKSGGDVSYEWTTPSDQKVKPYKGRYWAYSREKMDQMAATGLLYYRSTGMPMLKHYLEDMPGIPLQTFWDDIGPLVSGSDERLGYPTQKPLALWERIIAASSNENDIVLDAFCGCGTALVAAQKLRRQRIGIDISPTACRVMAKRLRDVCGMSESEPPWRAHRANAFAAPRASSCRSPTLPTPLRKSVPSSNGRTKSSCRSRSARSSTSRWRTSWRDRSAA